MIGLLALLAAVAAPDGLGDLANALPASAAAWPLPPLRESTLLAAPIAGITLGRAARRTRRER